MGISILFVLTIIVLALIIGYFLEKKAFNDGICPHCGKPLEYYDTDSQGGRGYICNHCDYGCWVSWKCIDKETLARYR
jgi:hypothetical protein